MSMYLVYFAVLTMGPSKPIALFSGILQPWFGLKGSQLVDLVVCPGALWAESLCHSGLWQILPGSNMESSHWPSITLPVSLVHFLPIMSHNPTSSLTSVPPRLLLQTGPLRLKDWPLHTGSASLGPSSSHFLVPCWFLVSGAKHALYNLKLLFFIQICST